MTADMSVIGFNNCRCRDHAVIYGDGAFYDLDTTGRQANEAIDLPVGQECVVAIGTPDNLVVFKWFSLQREAIMHKDTPSPCRVFFGDFLVSETLPKEQAARDRLYSVFFDRRGHFKQRSTIPFDVSQDCRPTRQMRRASFLPEEVDPSAGQLLEGATRQIAVNAYERNNQARAECIEHYGATCVVCEKSLADTYGPICEGFIHVHHLKPLSTIDHQYVVDPVVDLRPVCPNCHAVIHLGRTTRSIAEVKKLLRRPVQEAAPSQRRQQRI